MKWLLAATLFALAGAPSGFAGASQAKSSAHKRTSASAHLKSSVKHSHAASRSHSRRRRRAASRPSYQLHPDRERYRQIQQALADRGYFKKEEVDGVWGPDSVSALQRFQTDRKLPNDGHINALSLVALGLGPKHGSIAATTAPLSSAPPSSAPAPASSADHSAASGQ